MVGGEASGAPLQLDIIFLRQICGARLVESGQGFMVAAAGEDYCCCTTLSPLAARPYTPLPWYFPARHKEVLLFLVSQGPRMLHSDISSFTETPAPARDLAVRLQPSFFVVLG